MTFTRSVLCFAAAMTAIMASGCSDRTKSENAQRAQSNAPDPPGAAQVLSLGDERMLEGLSQLDNAAKCAAALKASASAITAISGGANAQEIRALKDIEQRYRRRAQDAALAEGLTADTASEAIRRQEVIGTRTEHAQFAVACLKAIDGGLS